MWTHNGGEFSEWVDFHHLKVSHIIGSEKKRLDAIDSDADVYVMNYENLQWLCTKPKPTSYDRRPKTPVEKLISAGVDVLIFDELSKMKHSNTKRFKAMKSWLMKFKRRWGLTGSPVANGLMDLFGEVFVLDLGQRLGRYITHYRFQYFLQTGYGGYTYVPKANAEQEIRAKISDICLSMRAEDHLDLKGMTHSNLWVELPPKVRKVYEDMEEELVALVNSGEVVAQNSAVATGKCRQIASGGLYIDGVNGDRKEEVIHGEKVDALMELIDELQGEPLLVAYEFHHDLHRIEEVLRKRKMACPAINGGVNDNKVAEWIRAWNAKDLPVLLGHPASMGHGLNLQKGGYHVCWFTPTWNFELYDQFNRRLYRQGQENRVMVHHILAADTVDELVMRALRTKNKGQSALMEALKIYAKQRGEK